MPSRAPILIAPYSGPVTHGPTHGSTHGPAHGSAYGSAPYGSARAAASLDLAGNTAPPVPTRLRLELKPRGAFSPSWTLPLLLTLFILATVSNLDWSILPGKATVTLASPSTSSATTRARADIRKIREHLDPANVTYNGGLAQPRAAFVALADETQLHAMVASMAQLEEHFNMRYRYNWVFFSRLPLSERFREVTSNATGAACVYEVIVPGKPEEDEGGSRWDSGLLARERRLRDYDWFWRVEPGSALSCDVNFDIFRFMRDNKLSYGFNQAILDRTHCPSPFWERTKVFVSAHPEMVHADAAIRHARRPQRSTRKTKVVRQSGPTAGIYGGGGGDKNNDGIVSDLSAPTADSQQGATGMGSEGMVDIITTWLSTAWDCCQLSSTFEIGSLAFLRSPQNVALFEHLDRDDGLLRQPSGGIPLHTISASIFLPRQSVWSIGSYPSYNSWPMVQKQGRPGEDKVGGDNDDDDNKAVRNANDDYDYGEEEEEEDDDDVGDDEYDHDYADDDANTVVDSNERADLDGYAECLGPAPTPVPEARCLDEVYDATDSNGNSVQFIGPVNEPCRRRGSPRDKLSAQHSQWAALARGVLNEKDRPKLMSGFTHVEWTLWWNSGSKIQERERNVNQVPSFKINTDRNESY